MEMFVLSYVNVPQILSSCSAKWLRTYLTNQYVILRYCSPIYVNETIWMAICPSARFKSIILWPGMNYLVTF